jgi:transcriptional regulator with PAS, ATPase and Fis domain
MLTILDRSVDAPAPATRRAEPAPCQLSLLDECAAAADAALSLEAAEAPFAPALAGACWQPAAYDGCRRWQFRGAMNGFTVELDLELKGGAAASFINDRLSRSGSFLAFLESLFAAERSQLPPAGGGVLSAATFSPPLHGDSRQMLELKRLVRRVSASDVSVLVEGESGTGKEVVAQNVHRLSPRRAKPLVIASCLEMPHTLLQSELFGHAEGAFTGASRDRAGLIESASGGTFFLDEIGEMPLSLQSTLLRVLQEKEVRRIGESRRRKVDVRFVFATNRDLQELVKRGRFREDLYFRINTVRLRVPALRDRKGDIVSLAHHFLDQGGDGPVPAISFGAMRRLLAYHWPGNVRELKNEMERLRALHSGELLIAPEMLSPHVAEAHGDETAASDARGSGLPAAVRALERRMIASALEECSGNHTRAARALGITRQGLLKKLKRYRMSRASAAGPAADPARDAEPSPTA